MGAKCSADSDCASGLICYGPISGFDRWPASGMCTARCAETSECTALESGSACWTLEGNRRYCLAGCKNGGSLTGVTSPLQADKCHGRSDLGCWNAPDPYEPACMPSCNNDSACGPDSTCDIGQGLCTKNAPDAGDIGIGYERDGGQQLACSTGYRRLDTTTDVLYCAAVCTLGVQPSCGFGGTGKASAACIFGPPGGGAGDLGSCAELCDCDSDCRAPLECRKLAPAYVNAFGRTGVCGGKDPLLAKCADGGTDAGTD